jgi:hypothetical protein
VPAPLAPLRWHVHTPVLREPGTGDPAGAADVPEWLVRLRRFRAEVLWADGLRPAFRGTDGEFHDDDPVDPFAHHVVATADGVPVATLRIVPLAVTELGFCDRLLGTGVVDAMLEQLGLARTEAWEGSGWAVQPNRRRADTGARALAGGSAVARELGLHTAIGAAGSRYGQLRRILAAGYRRAESIGPIHVPALADDVQLVHGTLDTLESGFQALVEQASGQLLWKQSSPTRVNRMTS